MLEPIRHILSRQCNILASGSPRRKEILSSIGLCFETVVSKFEENLQKDTFSHPCEYVKENAKQKAIEVWNRLVTHGPQKPDLIIGADTVVTIDGLILEKPIDHDDAIQMLSKLSGQKHTVFTGIALVTKSNTSVGTSTMSASGGGDASEQDYVVTTFHEATDVFMSEMTPAIIKAYINTGEPMDKAGAYGIQGIGGTLVEGIRGDYFNVVGIPLHRLCKELYCMYME